MKVALVYDRVNKLGGAERVLQALHQIYPQAPLYTAVYDLRTAPWAKEFKVIPSFLQNFPFAKNHHEFFAPLMPLAFESFNFDEYDVVISVTSAEAKGVITKPGTLHICYCLTPTRYLWNDTWDYPVPFLLRPLLTKLRVWDQVASVRPDVYLAISQNVAGRIKKYYHGEAEVIYPPIDLEKFSILKSKSGTNSQYFLIVSRLVPYKKIDLAVEAFNKLGLPLKIIGTGSEMAKLKNLAKGNVEFLGQLTDEEVLSYYQRCQAVIFPGSEDFGLVPLEAAACGKPVIAYRGGGALETIVDGKTGVFFWPQTPEALAGIIKSFKPEEFKSEDCRAQAEKFNLLKFKESFGDLVKKRWTTYSKNIFI